MAEEEQFGPNAWLVDEMYEQYRADPQSVSESWQEFFADYHTPLHPNPHAVASTDGDEDLRGRRHRSPGRAGHRRARTGARPHASPAADGARRPRQGARRAPPRRRRTPAASSSGPTP